MMQSVDVINSVLRVTSIAGFFLSVYAYIVETSKEHDSSYTALCDINEHMSCSRVFTSKYGRGFGILYHVFGEDSMLNQPNSVGGIIFYSTLLMLSYSDTVLAAKALIGLSILSNIGSVYLACILYFVLHDFCVVCVSTYVVNAVNLILCVIRLKKIQSLTYKTKDD